MKSIQKSPERFKGVHCVFLDRDGVINRKADEGRYIGDWKNFEVLSGVESSIARLNAQGYRVIVVSNQRGIALGLSTTENVEALHARLQRQLGAHGARIDAFYYCPHDYEQCDCRKPATGLFERALREFPDITVETSVLVGDSLSDIEAAVNFGCRSIFIIGDLATRKPGCEKAKKLADAAANSLADAVQLLLLADIP